MEHDIFGVLQEVSGKIEQLNLKFSKYQSNQVTAFRGESRDWGNTSLTPSIFRMPINFNQENELFDLLEDFDIAKGRDLSNLDKATEAQHYMAFSRLLDITFNVLPAIYFACENDFEHDAKLYIFSFPEHYSPHSGYLREYFDLVLDETKPTFYKNFKVITHSFSNERIKSQSGGFILFPSREYYAIPELYYEVITINKIKKKPILNELENFFNISNATIYPEKDKRRDYITKRIKKNNYVNRKNNIESEVDSYLKMADLEMQIIISECQDCTPSEVHKIVNVKLREFRKSEEDLIGFIKTNTKDADQAIKLIAFCKQRYAILKYNLVGVKQ